MDMTNDARFWNRSARAYAARPVQDEAGYRRTLERSRTLLPREGRALELGCGSGSTAMRLADGVRHYLATDISSEMIAIAGERLAATPVPGLAFRVATVETVAPQDGPFDAVLGFNYLHLVPDLPDTLRRIHDLLRPGGLFISKTPCVGDMSPLIGLVLPVLRAFGKAPNASIFREDQLLERIAAAGFAVEAAENHVMKGSEVRPYVVARRQ